MLSSFRNPIKRIFELDLRSLGLARACLGFLVLVDCIFRLTNFSAHYTDLGVLPLQVLEKLAKPMGPCVHCLSNSEGWMAGLFALHAFAAIALMLGWRTRISIFLCWLMTISIHYRNPLIIDGGDVLLRCFLVWMFFLPCAEYFSLDAKNKKHKATTHSHWLNLVLPLQLFALYFVSALLKTGEDWWPLGTATGYALSLEAFVTPVGKWMTEFPESLKLLTRIVFLTELWAPFLLLMWGWWRFFGVLIFMFLHLGLGLAMDLALFPWIAFGCLFSIFPKEFWELFSKVFPNKIPNSNSNTLRTSKIQTALSFLGLSLAGVAIAWNVATLIKKPLPKAVRKVAQWSHIDQYWGMFAPFPLKDSGWYEFGLELWNGEYVYAFADDKMEDQWDEENKKPIQGNKYFIDQRWRKYLINLWDKSNARYRPSLAAFVCRKWNKDFEAPSDQALKLDMEFKLFQNNEYLKSAREPASINLGTYKCPEKKAEE